MKKVLFFLLLGGAVLLHHVKAQALADTATAADKPDSAVTAQTQEAETIIYRYDQTRNVVQTSGKVFTAKEIARMPVGNVNQVAETVAGVQRTGNGAAPNIRCAGSAGTAYFVDGVRVYGALPPVMNSR